MNPENEIDKTEALEPVETAAANVAEARGGVDGRKRPKWLLPLIAVVCAVVLVVAGVVGWNMYRGAKLAEAKEACAARPTSITRCSTGMRPMAVKAVTESKAAKTLETAKTNLTAKLDEAAKLLTDSDGKVQDNTTRETLTNAIDAATRLKDANDATKIDKARKTLEDAINGVNASVQAKTDADAQAAAAAAAAAQVQAQSTYSGGSSYSGNTYRRTGGSTSGSNTYRGTTSGGSGSNSGSGSTGGSTTRPNLNGAYGCTEDCYVPPNNLIQH